MKEGDFLAQVVGKRITGAQLAQCDSMGDPPCPHEVIVVWLELDDGSCVHFTASAQIGYDDVWASVEPLRA